MALYTHRVTDTHTDTHTQIHTHAHTLTDTENTHIVTHPHTDNIPPSALLIITRMITASLYPWTLIPIIPYR